jgi:hypothetical protein
MNPLGVSVDHSIDIAADLECVWHALTDPASVVVWDTGIVAPIDAPADYPRPGQTVRWRYRLLGMPVILIDRPQEVARLERLRTLISVVFLRIDETYTLKPLQGQPGHTRLAAHLDIGNTLPLFRRAFDRGIGQSLATQTIIESLSAIRTFCEKK